MATELKEMARELVNGADAGMLMQRLKARYQLSYVSSQLSRIKSKVIEIVEKEIGYDDSALRPFESEMAIALFLKLSLKEKLKARHKAKFSEDAQAALQSVQYLPEAIASSLESFKLSAAEVKELKRAARHNRKLKNRNPIVVNNTVTLLTTIERMLENATWEDSLGKLMGCLLLCSGRRKSELLNGRSKFAPVPGKPFYALFEGQCKKTRMVRYKIPLLVPFHTFAIGYLALRTKLIGHIEDADGMDLVTLNEAVSQKHSNTIRDELNALIASQEVPLPPMKVHDLRSTYTACVYHLYETDLPLNTVAQAVLGHEDLEESLSYANVRLRDAGEPGRLGTLEYQFTDMTESESNSDGYESE